MDLEKQVEVVNPDGTPAPDVVVVLNADDMQGITQVNGMARLSINTVKNNGPLIITVSVEICKN